MEQQSFEGNKENFSFYRARVSKKRMGRIEVGGIAALPFILHFQQSGTSREGKRGEGRKKVNLYLRSKRFAPSTARVKGEIAVEAATTVERASSSRSQVQLKYARREIFFFAVKFIRLKISGEKRLYSDVSINW